MAPGRRPDPKVLVVGNVATGKTSFIQRSCRGHFTEAHHATIGVDFSLKSVRVNGEEVKIQLWDVAGQERFASLTRVYYKDAVAAFVVYDVSSRSSFESVAMWRDDIRKKVELPNGEPLPLILIGNKCDLPDDQRRVSREEGERLKVSAEFSAFFETSAKNNTGITEACAKVAELVQANSKRIASARPGPPAQQGANGRAGPAPADGDAAVRIDKNPPGGKRGKEKGDGGCCG